ncbi:MAG: hypothetical protein ACRCUP_05565 [Mycoplasmatales bacterium]
MDENQVLKRAKIDLVIGIGCKIFIKLSPKPTTQLGSILMLVAVGAMIFFIVRGVRGYFKYYKMKKGKE